MIYGCWFFNNKIIIKSQDSWVEANIERDPYGKDEGRCPRGTHVLIMLASY